PDDRLALVTVLRSPLCAIGDEHLLRLAFDRKLRLDAILGADGPLHAPPDPGEAERYHRFRAVFGELRRRADRLGPAGVLRHLSDATGYEIVLAAGPEGE